MNQEQKDKIISSVYHNNEGYKSQYRTYVDANNKEPSIRLKDVRDWFVRKVEKPVKKVGGGIHLSHKVRILNISSTLCLLRKNNYLIKSFH